MLPSLRELGLLSARYAEEEAMRTKQELALSSTSSSNNNSTSNSSAPVPTTIVSQGLSNVVSTSSSSSVSSTPLLGSPIIFHASGNSDNNSLRPPFQPIISWSTFQGLALAAQMGLLPALNLPLTTPITTATAATATTTKTAVSTTTSPVVQQCKINEQPTSTKEVLSSLPTARLRKPFHKRRPAHMDKSMLFCHFCGRKETPEWRKGPAGPATLCNACGLQWAKKLRDKRSSPLSTEIVKPDTTDLTTTLTTSSSKVSSDTSSDIENVKSDA